MNSSAITNSIMPTVSIPGSSVQESAGSGFGDVMNSVKDNWSERNAQIKMTRQNLPRATGRKTAQTQKRIFITTMPLTSTTHATRAATTNRAISTKTIMPRSANRNPMNIKMSALIAATIRRAIRTHRQATNPMHRAMTPAPPRKHLLIL